MAKPDGALAARKVLAAARGARLCYGDPVQVDGRTVIPVARVRAGARFGRGGGGGGVKAVPVGFIEVAAEGTRFERIEQPRVGARVRAGGGFGRGGGGGGVDAVPVGFIEVAAEGTRFERIEQPRVGARALAAGGAAVTGLMAAAALRRPRPTLPRPPRRRSLPR